MTNIYFLLTLQWEQDNELYACWNCVNVFKLKLKKSFTTFSKYDFHFTARGSAYKQQEKKKTSK